MCPDWGPSDGSTSDGYDDDDWWIYIEFGLLDFHVVGQIWACFLSPDLGRRSWGVWSPCKTIEGIADVRRNCSRTAKMEIQSQQKPVTEVWKLPPILSQLSVAPWSLENDSHNNYDVCEVYVWDEHEILAQKKLKADYSENHYTVISSEVCILLGRLVGQ